MNLTFFLMALGMAWPGQAVEPQTGVQSKDASTAEQLAEVERRIGGFRHEWVAQGETVGLDGKPMPAEGPNVKLITLESVVTELEMDARGKEALWCQLQAGAAQSLNVSNEMISDAHRSYLKSYEMLCKAKDQLEKVKAQQRDGDTRMAKYIRLIEARDSLRLKLAQENEDAELARLRGMSLDELQAAVSRTQAALESALRAHQRALTVFSEANKRSKKSVDGDSTSRPDSLPAGD